MHEDWGQGVPMEVHTILAESTSQLVSDRARFKI